MLGRESPERSTRSPRRLHRRPRRSRFWRILPRGFGYRRAGARPAAPEHRGPKSRLALGPSRWQEPPAVIDAGRRKGWPHSPEHLAESGCGVPWWRLGPRSELAVVWPSAGSWSASPSSSTPAHFAWRSRRPARGSAWGPRSRQTEPPLSSRLPGCSWRNKPTEAMVNALTSSRRTEWGTRWAHAREPGSFSGHHRPRELNPRLAVVGDVVTNGVGRAASVPGEQQ
jgi:hypothetical protein